MADISARAERVRAIVETHGAKVSLRHICDIVRVDVPADVAPGLAMLWNRPAEISVSGIPVRKSPARSMSPVATSTMATPPFKG